MNVCSTSPRFTAIIVEWKSESRPLKHGMIVIELGRSFCRAGINSTELFLEKKLGDVPGCTLIFISFLELGEIFCLMVVTNVMLFLLSFSGWMELMHAPCFVFTYGVRY